jgi:hypothetical protein
MPSSPTKEPESIPRLAPPPSPRTHRALRKLNSQPSLIQLQHRQHLQHNLSPASTPHHSRGRSNSDASNMTPPNLGTGGRRPLGKRPVAADALSLDRLIRDGPPDGDIITALESTRLKILDQGIKSDTDGMVRRYLDAIRTSMLMFNSHLFGYMFGSYYSMLQSSKPIPISLSYTVEHLQRIPKSETIPFEL